MESTVAQQVWHDFEPAHSRLTFRATDYRLYRQAGSREAGKIASKSHVSGRVTLDGCTLELIGKPETQSAKLEFSIAPYESHEQLRADMRSEMGDAVRFSPDAPAEGFTSAEQFHRWLMARMLRDFEKEQVPLAQLFLFDSRSWSVQIYVSRDQFRELCEDVIEGRAGVLDIELTFRLIGTPKGVYVQEKSRLGFLRQNPHLSGCGYGEGAVVRWQPTPKDAPASHATSTQDPPQLFHQAQVERRPEPVDHGDRNWLMAGVIGIWIGVALLAIRLW